MGTQDELKAKIADLHGKLSELQSQNGDDVSVLHPAASEEDIVRAEAAAAHPLPPSYKAFLRLHAAWEHFWGDTTIIGSDPPGTEKARAEIREALDDEEELRDYTFIATGFDGSGWVLDKRTRDANGEMKLVRWDLGSGIDEEQAFDGFDGLLDFALEQVEFRLQHVERKKRPARVLGEDATPEDGWLQSDELYTDSTLWVTPGDTRKYWNDANRGGYWYWQTTEPNVVTIGLLRDKVEEWHEELASIELAPVGTKIERGGPLGTIVDGDGDAHEIAAPIAGEIVSVNDEAISDPGMVCADWYATPLVRMRIAGAEALRGLAAYHDYSYDRPFADEGAERDYLKSLLADNGDKEFVEIAVASNLACSFLVRRMVRLGLLRA